MFAGILLCAAKPRWNRPLAIADKTNIRACYIVRNEKFRVLARLCDDLGGGVAALRRTTGEDAKRRQVPEILVS